MSVEPSATLSKLLAGFSRTAFDHDPVVKGLALDSRIVFEGDCFFALEGTRAHGMRYLHEAISRGAVAVVTERAPDCTAKVHVPVAEVPSLNELLGKIAARFFYHPSEHLAVIAVTGTNGKTTVAHLCAQALSLLDLPCGYIGTLGRGPLNALCPSGMTTPDAITLQNEFKKLLKADFRAVALEASSHSLVQSRLAGTAVDVAIFTGLGHDHLDYHGSLEAYAKAKQKLFQHPGLGHAVINIDDELGRRIRDELNPAVQAWECSLLGTSAHRGAKHYAYARAVAYNVTGTRLDILTSQGSAIIESELVGEFNAQNLLLALTAMLALNFPLTSAAAVLARVKPVIGRLEAFGATGNCPRIYIDYAHSPDSLERVLKVLRAFAPTRVFSVFGCGGSRDRTKRPLMGSIAQRYSDHVYLTSDNPRDEDPKSIVNEILAGFDSVDNVTVIEDRVHAITTALAAASATDIVLIAGKGHETDQIIGTSTVPMSDQTIVRRWLEAQG